MVDEGYDVLLQEDECNNTYKPPLKKISLAVLLLIFGIFGFILGIYMSFNKIGGGISHGILFAIIGAMVFLPGFYHTRIAYYAYKGYSGFSFSHIPAV